MTLALACLAWMAVSLAAFVACARIKRRRRMLEALRAAAQNVHDYHEAMARVRAES